MKRIHMFRRLFYRLWTSGVTRKIPAYDHTRFRSQCGQDFFVAELISKGCKNGVFVDIGANDGVTFSNTHALEKHYGWKGLCVEPMPDKYQECASARTCLVEHCCAGSGGRSVDFIWVKGNSNMLSVMAHCCSPAHQDRITHEISSNNGDVVRIAVPCYSVNELLEKHKIAAVDYLSIDVEGGEMDVLKSVDLAKFRVEIVSCENNEKNLQVPRYMRRQGFRLVAILGDEIYMRDGINVQ